MVKDRILDKDLLSAVLPFSVPKKLKRLLTHRLNVIYFHFITISSLYLVFFISTYFGKVFYIPNGIGVIQNPPFFAHLIAGTVSIPIIWYLIKNLSVLKKNDDFLIVERLLELLETSFLKKACFYLLTFIGLVAIAFTIVLSASYFQNEIRIYDSIENPFSFATYLFIRAYLYLFCYPLIISSVALIIYFLFASIQTSDMPYTPFHKDNLGGFGKYLAAVDKPVYVIQTLAVLVALLNYFGWGGLKLVPLILLTTIPILVTCFAFILYGFFYKVLKIKKNKIIEVIRNKQQKLFKKIENPEKGNSGSAQIVEELEASERLIEMINKNRNTKMIKYILNLATLLIPKAIDLFMNL